MGGFCAFGLGEPDCRYGAWCGASVGMHVLPRMAFGLFNQITELDRLGIVEGEVERCGGFGGLGRDGNFSMSRYVLSRRPRVEGDLNRGHVEGRSGAMVCDV